VLAESPGREDEERVTEKIRLTQYAAKSG